ncbi:dehydrogenase [Clostridia bacterium]|nr:dehydrogenase [Clostridia bacterium]
MRKLLKVGIIGTGFIGPVHVEAARRTGQAEVTALVEKDEKTAVEKAELLGIPLYFADYKAMLARPDIDIVHICSPNSFHYQMSKDALLSGKHVVCEKPLTFSRDEAEELVRIAAEKRLVNAVHFNMRYYSLSRHAHTMVRNGSVGKIYSITGSYLQDWLLLDTDYSWRLESKVSGPTRAIGDIGSHWLDLTEYASGLEIEAVMADFATFHKTRKKPKMDIISYENTQLSPSDYDEIPIDTEDYATVMLRFKGGAKGVLTVSQMAAGRKNRITYEINGDKCSVIWDSEEPNQMLLGRRDRPNELLFKDPSLLSDEARKLTSYPAGHNEGFADATKQFLNELYAYILAEDWDAEPKFPTFADGCRDVILCEAIAESAKTGRWVVI